jgi:hypothetical protein
LQASQRSDRQAVAEIVVLGPRRPLHRHRDIDDVPLDRADGLVAKAEFFHRARSEVVGDDVAGSDQTAGQFLALGGLQIERDAALGAVTVCEIAAAVDPRLAVLVGPAAAQGIHALVAFDLDNIGAVVGEQLCGERTGADPGEVGDPDAFEGQTFQLTTPDLSRAACAAGS